MLGRTRWFSIVIWAMVMDGCLEKSRGREGTEPLELFPVQKWTVTGRRLPNETCLKCFWAIWGQGSAEM